MPLRVAAGLVALVAASLALRTGAMGEGMWIDEGLSTGIAGHPLSEIPGLLARDGSPALYYLALHGWTQLFGASDEAARALSLVAALATIPAALWAGWSLFGRRAGIVAAVLAAANPFLTAYAQEARMYALVALLSLLVAATFLHAFARRQRAYLPAFAAALALLVHAHNWGLYLAAGSLLAVAALAAGARDRRLAADAGLAYGAVALLYAPWAPTLLRQVAETGAPWSNVPGPGKLLDALLVPLGGGVVAVGVLALATAGLLRDRGRSERDRDLIALAVMAATAVALAWGVSQVEPNWADRYFAVALGPLLLAAAAGIARLGLPGLAATAAVALVWATDTGRPQHSNARALARAVPTDERTLAISTQPKQLPVLRRYLGPAPRYATTLGPAADPHAMDWRDAVARLRATAPRPAVAALLGRARPGDRIVLVRPVIARANRWRAPWTRLVRERDAQWAAALRRSPQLEPARTVEVPTTGGADLWAREWRVRAP